MIMFLEARFWPDFPSQEIRPKRCHLSDLCELERSLAPRGVQDVAGARSKRIGLSLRQKFRPPGREDSEQIVIKGKDHQENDKDETDLLGDFHFLDADWPS